MSWSKLNKPIIWIKERQRVKIKDYFMEQNGTGHILQHPQEEINDKILKLVEGIKTSDITLKETKDRVV